MDLLFMTRLSFGCSARCCQSKRGCTYFDNLIYLIVLFFKVKSTLCSVYATRLSAINFVVRNDAVDALRMTGEEFYNMAVMVLTNSLSVYRTTQLCRTQVLLLMHCLFL